MRSTSLAIGALLSLALVLVAGRRHPRLTLHEDALDDAISPPAKASPGDLRVEYHTASGRYEAGCARSFHHTSPSITFNLTVARTSQQPLISAQIPAGQPGSSPFAYCYNAAYVPMAQSDGQVATALLVRCQNLTDPSDPYSVGPSFLALATSSDGGRSFAPLTDESIVFRPEETWEVKGTEDPRITFDNTTGVYYLMYSACSPLPNGDVLSRLSLATTTDPTGTNDKWIRHGFVVANNGSGNAPSDYGWSKSGALLATNMEGVPVVDDEPEMTPGANLLIFGDSSIAAGLQTAQPSSDFLSYTYNSTIYLDVRTGNEYFDSDLVEAGPAPMRLSNGMRLFLYNSARVGVPSPKPNWSTQYNVGFLLLDALDPYTIVARSSIPIFSPELAWEVGTAPWLGLTPNVVFVEGARWVPGQPVVDTFDFWYGAADSCVGGARITLTFDA